MKHYRLKDVPKGQRISYFFTYYSWQLFYALFGLLIAGVLIYSTFLHPRTDVSILWLTSDYNLMTDTALKESFKELPWDFNGDGKTSVALQYIDFPDELTAAGMGTMMQSLTLISSGRFPIFLLSETALNWFKETGLAGTWADYGATEAPPWRDLSGSDEVFAIPCSELAFFRGTALTANQETYLVIGYPPTEEKELTDYRAQVHLLEDILLWE